MVSLIIAVGLLSACRSVVYLDIETFNPAAITYPAGVNKILVVNNAVTQPPATGFDCIYFDVAQDTCRAEADSAIWNACKYLGKAILENDYFEDVLLYHLPVRTDDSFLEDKRLTPGQVKELCMETGVDAIISFDRLIFKMKKELTRVAPAYVGGTLRIDVKGVVRAYHPEMNNPLATLVVTDSLQAQEVAIDKEMIDILLPTPEEALRIAGRYIGTTVSTTFVPHWQETNRWYYTGSSSRWKEATAFAAAQKWEMAGEKWQVLYDKNEKGKTKAKLASNLALAEEMKGNFDKAHEWAVISRDLFKESTGEDSNETKLLTNYIEVISNRAIADKKLDLQFAQ